MAVTDCFVSVVAPVGNDAAIVEAFVREVIEVLRANYTNYELVLVDDGSEDDTVALVTSLLQQYECTRLLRLSRRFGEEIAIFAGLDSVIGDFIVVMLPDSDPPQLIPQMVGIARRSGGVVFGIAEGRPRQPLLTRLGTVVFYWYCRRIAKVDLPRNTTQFRVLSRQAVNAITQVKNVHRYLRVLSTHVGYGSVGLPYHPISRSGQPPSRHVLQALNAAIDIVIGSSGHPLRFVSSLGVLAGLVNMLYAMYVVAIYVIKDQVAEGWTTLSLQTSAMFFFVFLILTVSSEYLGHILGETIERPLYHVLEERHSAVLVADEDRTNVVTHSDRGPREFVK